MPIKPMKPTTLRYSFFSSTAFSMLENAMSVIFIQRARTQRRNFLVSAIIPYVYIFLIGLGVALVSFVVGAIETLESRHLTIFGLSLDLGGSTGAARGRSLGGGAGFRVLIFSQ